MARVDSHSGSPLSGGHRRRALFLPYASVCQKYLYCNLCFHSEIYLAKALNPSLKGGEISQ